MRIFAVFLLSVGFAWAQEEVVEDSGPPAVDDDVFVQAVEVDGEQLFAVRGSTALPAEERAALVAKRVVEVAEGSEATTVVMGVERGELGQAIFADGVLVSITTQADADYEQMELAVLASLHAEAIEAAILTYRANRTDEAFSHSTLTALAWSAIFALYCGILFWLRKRVPRLLAGIVEHRTRGLQEATGDIVQSQAVSNISKFLIRLLVDITLFTGFYYYLSFVLHSFPNTRPVAALLIRYVTDPIIELMMGFVSYMPNLITIVIIAAIARWMIKAVYLFFESVDKGVIELKTFEDHWVWPTYNLIRGGIILTAAVICFLIFQDRIPQPSRASPFWSV